MRPATFQALGNLRRRFDKHQFGKIAQKLLAITFAEAGWNPTEREVQGVDVDVIGPAGEKHAIEVKTTKTDSVQLDRENVDALRREWEADGYRPTVAVLRMNFLEDWLIAAVPATELRPGALPIRRLRPYASENLQAIVRSRFDDVVKVHYDGTLKEGGQYLQRVLSSLTRGTRA